MKRLLLSFIAIATISFCSLGQAPEAFKYQAVVRDAGNTILNNQAVGMRMTIQQGSIGGTTIYQETFATTTNAFGLVNLEIGKGTVVSGTFASIDWAAGPYFIQTAVDVTGGANYVQMGTSELMSVPYALHAKTAESVLNDQVNDADSNPTNEIQDITLSGTNLSISNGSTIDLSVIDTDTKLTEAEVDAFVSNNKTTKDILISPHMTANSTSVSYPPGYPRQVWLCPGNQSTVSGYLMIDIPVPSDWDSTNMTLEVYYSSNATGTTNLGGLVSGYKIGEANYIAYGAGGCLTIDAPYTLYSFTETVTAGGLIEAGDKLMTIIVSRYDYEYAGNPCNDTNTGDVYIHGIKLTYKAKL